MNMKDSEKVTYKILYDFVDIKTEKIDNRLSNMEKQLSNMEGRAMMIPILISMSLGFFFLIINFVLSKIPSH